VNTLCQILVETFERRGEERGRTETKRKERQRKLRLLEERR
jgi:hypothetical protein